MISQEFIQTMYLSSEFNKDSVNTMCACVSDEVREAMKAEENEGWSRLGRMSQETSDKLISVISEVSKNVKDEDIILSY